MKLPTLYKKTSTGAIQMWTIEVHKVDFGAGVNKEEAVITTTHGQVNGKLQVTCDTIKEGKNIGKKNETAPLEQAKLEAEAKWEKQLKNKGYVQTLKMAEAGDEDALVAGGIKPMLAHKFQDHGHKIKFPAYLSPKLDGIRCIATIKNGKVKLWTRTQKSIDSVPHIVAELERVFAGRSIILDGELYHHDYRDDFNEIISLVRPEAPVPGHEIVQYHIFDYVAPEDFFERFNNLVDAMEFVESKTLQLVQQHKVLRPAEAGSLTATFIKSGYEGGMIKNWDGGYEHKRSYRIQKIKVMQDAEFPIVGAEEGRGKLAGHVGSFVCQTADGQRFNAKLEGELDRLSYLWQHPEEWQGKSLTVRYQNLSPDGIPRFPIGAKIKDPVEG